MKKRFYIFTIIIAFMVKVNAQDYTGYNGCALQDSLALVAFYHATDGPNWISNQDGFSINNLSDEVLTYYTTDYPNAGLGKWLEGPVKDWFGVLLEKQQIGNTTDSAWRVIHLHPRISRRSAGENNLKGYVPKEVGLLTALEWFKVNGNVGFTNTELPGEIFHSTLKEIDLEGAYFSGDVSEDIRNSNRIEFINIRDNNFDTLPNVDFIDLDVLNSRYVRNGGRHLFLYRNNFSWATIEVIIDYFELLGNDYLFEARDQKDVGRAREIVVTPGSTVTLTCYDAGMQGTCTWIKKGINTYVTSTTYTIENVSASDTGNYWCQVANEYIRLKDDNADYAETYTKPIHVTFVPSKPVSDYIYSSYSGNEISLRFSKPMAVPLLEQTGQFAIEINGASVSVNSISRTGRLNNILVLGLEESIQKGDTVTISYTKGSVVDVNGGELNTFAERSVVNLVRETPTLVGAQTRKDGEGIVLEFDHFIDPQTFDPGDFSIVAAGSYNIEEITLSDSEIDEGISNKVTLILDESIPITDTVLKVSYNKGSLIALYGAAVQSFADYPVENVVDSNRLDIKIYIVDGSSSLDEVVVKGNIKIRPISMSDNGDSGDDVAGDNTWTKLMQLSTGTYEWEVYNRKTITTYDTVKSIDSETGIETITITPISEYVDSLISGTELFSLTVDFDNKLITGDTIFKYRTNTVVFVLDMKDYLEENEGVAIDPYVMGINGDWLKGLPMTETDPANPDATYTAVATGFNIGDVFQYNFRNGDVWENTSSVSRIDTVEGNDTVKVVFSVGVSGVENIVANKEKGTLDIFPNPVGNSYIVVKLPENGMMEEISVFNLYGQQILHRNKPGQRIDISAVPKGVYFISITDMNGNKYQSQIIRK